MSDTRDKEVLALSPKERRERNRQAMVDSIVAAARAIMREDGVAALNLNEVARRVQLRPQSLASYFPHKSALYDELSLRAMRLFLDGDMRACQIQPPSWRQLEAWYANRIQLAYENPDYFHLGFDAPVPTPYIGASTVAVIEEIRVGVRTMVENLIAARVIDSGMSIERTMDVLLSIRHGMIAEHLGKEVVLPPGSTRFSGLLPDVMRMLQMAWAPERPAPAAGGDVTTRRTSKEPETPGRGEEI